MKEQKQILLVENNSNHIELMLTAIDEYRLANMVVVARNGEEALDYLYRRGKFKTRPTGNPVVILLNVKIPKVDGLEVLRRIKSDEQLKMIPVVMVTSSNNEEYLFESYQLGANGYVVKPTEFNQFFEAMMGLSLFWGVINEPPPGRNRKEKPQLI